MKAHIKITLIFACISVGSLRFTLAQSYTNNWVFGDSMGLNFSSGAPEFFKTSINEVYESCAAISDKYGDLIFYTNGETVWDRAHNQMPNGDSLNIGQLALWGSSITQGVLIAPFPGNDRLFYIFYLKSLEGLSFWDLTPEYSIVDLSLNGGFGDVSEKNIPLSSDTINYEKLQLVKHGNGRDWWLLALKREPDNTMYFVKFLITPAGISGPFYQLYADSFHEDDGTEQLQATGYMQFSPDGDKVCITKSFDIDLYDFDRCSGEFSNFINIDSVTNILWDFCYGIAFSKDEQYLYVATTGTTWDSRPSRIYQFCFSCVEPVQSTKTLIYQTYDQTLCGALLGPDEKIYLIGYDHDTTTADSNLYVINHPEIGGLGCDLDTLSIYLGGQAFSYLSLGLPNMPQYDLWKLPGSYCDSLLDIIHPIISDEFQIYPNPSTGTVIINGGSYPIYDLLVYNMQGEIVYVNKKTPVNGSIHLPLSNGIYEMVFMHSDAIIQIVKLIISK